MLVWVGRRLRVLGAWINSSLLSGGGYRRRLILETFQLQPVTGVY
ncbi:hypothetical protein F383_23280 [Gossypium arboreum]|uniref:Uncharacterized protein n=1 Tax=Gossypium arboreum TaxID=29729 RepID=A0A0B0NTP0_GOSAR|nr:hypothetical protein F383_23280 [Gossypium arboreum]